MHFLQFVSLFRQVVIVGNLHGDIYSHLNKYNLQSGQIQLAIWTNLGCHRGKFARRYSHSFLWQRVLRYNLDITPRKLYIRKGQQYIFVLRYNLDITPQKFIYQNVLDRTGQKCQRNVSRTKNSRPLKYNCQWNCSKLKTELGGLIIWLIEAVAIWQPDFHISWELSFSKAKTKGHLRSQILMNFQKIADFVYYKR